MIFARHRTRTRGWRVSGGTGSYRLPRNEAVLAAIEGMLASYRGNGALTVLTGVSVEKVASFTVSSGVPLGATIPVRMDNLLPAAKNIATTHITNGCHRLPDTADRSG